MKKLLFLFILLPFGCFSQKLDTIAKVDTIYLFRKTKTPYWSAITKSEYYYRINKYPQRKFKFKKENFIYKLIILKNEKI
jgi:hypothetical protein